MRTCTERRTRAIGTGVLGGAAVGGAGSFLAYTITLGPDYDPPALDLVIMTLVGAGLGGLVGGMLGNLIFRQANDGPCPKELR